MKHPWRILAVIAFVAWAMAFPDSAMILATKASDLVNDAGTSLATFVERAG